MSIQVICAGLGRTGTLSLRAALEELGFAKCNHPLKVFASLDQARTWAAAARGEPVDWDRIFAGYGATVDMPGRVFYRELLAKYPEAKVILTVRDPERWYDSVSQTIDLLGNTFPKWTVLLLSPRQRVFQRMLDRLRDRMFQGRFEDQAFAIDVFTRHNEQVRRDVPADRLLVYEISQGWGPLCAFLGVPVPEGKPFPHLNDAAAFRAKINRDVLVVRTVGYAALGMAALVPLILIAAVAIRLWFCVQGTHFSDRMASGGHRSPGGPHVCGRCPPDGIAFHNDERLHQSFDRKGERRLADHHAFVTSDVHLRQDRPPSSIARVGLIDEWHVDFSYHVLAK